MYNYASIVNSKTRTNTAVAEDCPQFVDAKLKIKCTAVPPNWYEIETVTKKQGNTIALDDALKTSWSVTRVPEYYPLERSSVTVPTDIPLHTIVKRASIFLRMKSINCSFNPECGFIDCQTPCMLEFVIQIWRSEAKHFILEMQRCRGCSIQMASLRKEIFKAIITGENLTNENECGETTTEVSKHSNHVIRNNDQRMEMNIMDELSTCLQLLESEYDDQNQLGMESLTYITDPKIVCPECALAVSKMVSLGEGTKGKRIRKHIAKWLHLTVEDGGCNGEFKYEEQEHNLTEDEDEFHLQIMESLALRVLQNVLEEAEKDNLKCNVSSADPFWRQIARCFVENLEVATDRPGQAAISARCLRLLSSGGLQISPNLEQVLRRARQYGNKWNLTLEIESEGLLDLVKCQ